MTIEERLRALMSRRAESVEADADWSDLEHRVQHGSERRRRLVVSAIAVVLLVGPVAGFALARAVQDDRPSVVASSPGPDADPTPPSEQGRVPLVPTDGSGFGYTYGYGYGPGPLLECGGYGGIYYFPGDVGRAGECEPLELLFRREGAIVVRAYQSGELTNAGGCGSEGACPPPECFPQRYLSAGLSTADAVGTARGPLYETLPAPVSASHGFFGVGEGAPVAWAVAQVGGDVATVRVRFAAGGEDEMDPVDGVAVLASAIASTGERGDIPALGGTLEVLDAAGGVLATTDLVPDVPVEQQVLNRPECAPVPPSLPEPNGPPPADEAAASAAIAEAFAIVYADERTQEERFARIDDPAGVAEATEEVAANFPGALDSDNSVRIEELRFLNATEAAVRYTIVLPGYTTPEFPNRIGGAVLVDGVWKVTHETICHDLALGSGGC